MACTACANGFYAGDDVYLDFCPLCGDGMDYQYGEGQYAPGGGYCWYCGEWSPIDNEGHLHCRDRECTDFQATAEGEAVWRDEFDVPDDEEYVPMVNASDFDWEADALKSRTGARMQFDR